MQIFTILGSHPTLSLSEIAVVTGQKPSTTHHDVAIFDDMSENLEALNAKLGGIQKIGVIIGAMPSWNHADLAAFLVNDLLTESAEGKIHFGTSVYNFGNNSGTERARRDASKLGMEIKSELQHANHPARYVISSSPTLSSVVITKNHLLERGAEYCFFVGTTEILIGKTVAVQDVDAWAGRDFGRPRRNAKQGMLPPKLARMMVNLAGIDTTQSTVFDPFCGSGTILMEAALLGAKALIGSDINAEATADTKENLEWVRNQGMPMPSFQLFPNSAQTVSEHLKPHSIDAIVTETYLGRPRKGTETHREVDDAIAYVANLYHEAFSGLLPSLKPGATLLIAAPVHTFDGKDIAFDARTILEPLGYTHSPLPYEPVIYRHEGQLVGRRLWRFIAQ